MELETQAAYERVDDTVVFILSVCEATPTACNDEDDDAPAWCELAGVLPAVPCFFLLPRSSTAATDVAIVDVTPNTEIIERIVFIL